MFLFQDIWALKVIFSNSCHLFPYSTKNSQFQVQVWNMLWFDKFQKILFHFEDLQQQTLTSWVNQHAPGLENKKAIFQFLVLQCSSLFLWIVTVPTFQPKKWLCIFRKVSGSCSPIHGLQVGGQYTVKPPYSSEMNHLCSSLFHLFVHSKKLLIKMKETTPAEKEEWISNQGTSFFKDSLPHFKRDNLSLHFEARSLLIIRVNLLPFKNAARSPSLYPLWQFPLNTFHEFLTKKISVQSYWLVTVYSVHTNLDIQLETFSLLIIQVNFLPKFISKFLSPLATSSEHFPWIRHKGNFSSKLLAGHCLDT